MRMATKKSAATRAAILRSARNLFDLHGFHAVSIDDVMAGAGLTRGGFYKHFATKGELFAEAVKQAIANYNSHQRAHAGHDDTGAHILSGYLSPKHARNIDICPMFILPSDAADAGEDVKEAFQVVLEMMIAGLSHDKNGRPLPRKRALAIATLCMGGMVLAQSVEDPGLADELRAAALDAAQQLRNAGPASREREPDSEHELEFQH